MAYQAPPSPPLPTFAIKDLCGPANPPGLISISKRRYDATIKSAPDATLLYLDDDDGELITVGSSLELSQRLEEPVPRYIREYRNPADGNLVHVFDINHTSGSLVQWRDHEAYSSKSLLKVSKSEDSILSTDTASSVPVFSPHITYPSLPEPKAEEIIKVSVESSQPNSAAGKSSSKNAPQSDVSFNMLEGIEEHLSGLANVLQIAAETLQKAADKTRETDTSVVEDILLGVRGILTQVGSFGVEAFKELGAAADAAASKMPVVDTTDASTRPSTITEQEGFASQLAREAKEAYDARSVRFENPSSDIVDKRHHVQHLERLGDILTSKVKVDLPKEPVSGSIANTEPILAPISLIRPTLPAQPWSAGSALPGKVHNPSFLDDSSEDADFTARYPPLTTVRRARSTIERPSRRSKDWLNAYCKNSRPTTAATQADKRSAEDTSPSDVSAEGSSMSPFVLPSPPSKDLSPVPVKKIDLDNKPEKTEKLQKPLPGAWPDVKNESAPTLPVSAESSGDFFNRMVGRSRPGRYRAPAFEPSLHRSNTTASSNPASRLNGPFDPGFPYDPSPAVSSRPSPFRPYRPHRRSASPPRNWCNRFDAVRTRNEEQPSHPPTGFPPSLPAARIAPTLNSAAEISNANAHSKFDSHRAIKHYRSVPQFHITSSAPSHGPTVRPDSKDKIQPPHGTLMDTPAGPPMSIPPVMPFTGRPPFMTKQVPLNLWAPWQSAPPRQNAGDSAVPAEAAKESALNEFTPRRHLNSPVSSQSTMTRDFDLPSNEPPFPSAQIQAEPVSPPTGPHYSVSPAVPRFVPPPPPLEYMRVEPVKDKIEECLEQLKMCGFGVDDDNLKNRLHVYAVAADGDITEAVEMIEQDRRMTAPGRFD